LLLQLVFIE